MGVRISPPALTEHIPKREAPQLASTGVVRADAVERSVVRQGSLDGRSGQKKVCGMTQTSARGGRRRARKRGRPRRRSDRRAGNVGLDSRQAGRKRMVRRLMTAAVGAVVLAAVLAACTPAPLSVNTTSVPDGKVGLAYSTTLAASNGTRRTAGRCPPGHCPPACPSRAAVRCPVRRRRWALCTSPSRCATTSNKTATKALSLRVFGTTAALASARR